MIFKFRYYSSREFGQRRLEINNKNNEFDNNVQESENVWPPRIKVVFQIKISFDIIFKKFQTMYYYNVYYYTFSNTVGLFLIIISIVFI